MLDRPETPPAIHSALQDLRTYLAEFRASDSSPFGSAANVATAAQLLIDLLDMRTFLPEPGTDDCGEQVVITVYGVDLSIRHRNDGVFVHVDSSGMHPGLRPLLGEFNNGGENCYTEAQDDNGF